MKDFSVVYEWTGENWSAYPPDLPGCAATAATFDEIQEKIRSVIEFHLEGLRRHGYPIPEPTTRVGQVSVAA